MSCMHKWLLYAEGGQMIKTKNMRQNNLTYKGNQQEQNIDHEWFKENFITCEPDFYKTISK